MAGRDLLATTLGGVGTTRRFPLEFRFEAPGQPAKVIGFSRLAAAISDWSTFWPVFARRFWEFMGEEFASEGSSTGSTWAPLSPRYAAWKLRRFGPKGILQRRGRLLASLANYSAGSTSTGGNASGNADVVYRVSPTSLEIGTRVPYARYHQMGAPKAHLPKRPVMRLQDRQMRTIGKDLQYWVEQQRKLALAQGRTA
jgi:phage gpG-like protein